MTILRVGVALLLGFLIGDVVALNIEALQREEKVHYIREGTLVTLERLDRSLAILHSHEVHKSVFIHHIEQNYNFQKEVIDVFAQHNHRERSARRKSGKGGKVGNR